MNIFKEMFYSIFGTKKYVNFLGNKKRKVFLYVLVLVLLYTVIAHFNTLPATKDVILALEDELMHGPDFEIKSGKLYIEESISFEEDGGLILIESEYGSYINESSLLEWKEMLSGYETVIILDETTILVKSDGELQKMEYPETLDLSRDMVAENLDVIYVFVWIYLIGSYLFSVAGYFFAALFVALAGMIINSVMNESLTFGQLYLISLYAKTLPLLIKGVLKLASIYFFAFGLIGFVISCIYVGYAIHQKGLRDKELSQMEQEHYQGPIVF